MPGLAIVNSPRLFLAHPKRLRAFQSVNHCLSSGAIDSTGARRWDGRQYGGDVYMRKLMLALAALLGFMRADACASITYLVSELLPLDQGFGSGAVTGTITTDGTIGSLSYPNLQSWDLTAQVGSRSFTFNNSISGLTVGLAGLTATANH